MFRWSSIFLSEVQRKSLFLHENPLKSKNSGRKKKKNPVFTISCTPDSAAPSRGGRRWRGRTDHAGAEYRYDVTRLLPGQFR